jgi:hypothetical protein
VLSSASLAIEIDVLPIFIQNPVFVLQNFPDYCCVDIEPFPKLSSTFANPRPITCFFSANVKYLLGLRFFSDISAILFFDFATLIWSKIVRLTHR